MAEEHTIDVNELGEKIVRVIKTIYDPEIPVDIYELGLIYDVMVSTDREVKVLPFAESLPKEVQDKIKSLDDVSDCEVEITFEPEWNKDLMSEEAKLELGML